MAADRPLEAVGLAAEGLVIVLALAENGREAFGKLTMGLAQTSVRAAELARADPDVALLQRAAAAIGKSEPSPPPDVPEALVRQIFADPGAQDLLREVMAANDLTGLPGELAIETQRAIVVGLIQAGAIRFNDDEDDAEPPSTPA